MLSLLAPLLSSSKFWLVLVLITTNGISAFLGDRNGDARGYARGHAEYVTERAAFTLFKEQALEAAMAAQVQRDAETAARDAANKKVTEDYVQLASTTGRAMSVLAAERLRLLSTIEAARRSAASGDPIPGPAADATAEDRVLGECLQRYEEVAGDAATLSDKVKYWQSYAKRVVQLEK